MKKILLSFLLLTICTAGFCAKWTVTNSGLTFSPATITITVGDSVFFSIASMHNAVEVSQATWDANGTTPLPGFSVPFGGGLVLPSQLTAVTHYYVCTAHASSGMKGTIIVQNSASIANIQVKPSFSVYPNPSNGKIRFSFCNIHSSGSCSLKVYDISGERIYETKVTEATYDIDLSKLSNGVYFAHFFDGQSVLTKKIVIH